MSAPDLSLPLREAIDVPVQVHADDFVLQLHRGVGAEQRTLDDYVVTDAIGRSFDEALGLVKSALSQSSSKGAFIHGSFGSGKSHFMAVMHLLLAGSARARALPGLQSVVAKYETVLGKNFLAVDYHLLGKKSFEEALFTGYLQTVAERHPGSSMPVLHKSDGILADAERFRAQLGDEAFLAGLGQSDPDTSKWGKRGAAYTLESYQHAAAQPPDSADRQRLVRALVKAYFSSSVTSGEWLEISQGLRAMTSHAKDFGYDGIVLFLDELVLWLGQHLGDMTFIQSETSKVAKLVESEMGTLPVPLISFVARQRDLKDFLGGSAVGAEQVSLGQSFQWWEDRFDKLTLQVTDLPEIVHRRLLQPTSDRGRMSLEAAVARVKANPAAWKYLLDDEAGSGEVDFAKVYPFSPALVDAMIALSSLMQRERTALKIMSELLAAGRDELTVGDVIPVGDLFDVVVLGDAKPLTEDMKRRFQHAEAFYSRKLRPYLLAKLGLTEEKAAALFRNAPFRTEDRLAKTLLVAEIAPGAVSLKNLTAAKLAALNFGTVASFVPGSEAQQVLGWVRDWAKEFGEISIGGNPADPIISIQLSGVDYDSVLDAVRPEDTPANRRKLLRSLLLEALGVTTSGGLFSDTVHRHVWRGTRREADIVFGNIRDPQSLSEQALVASGGRWKVVIDYPFDDFAGHGPNDDVVRMYDLLQQGVVSDTIGWVPHYLSSSRMDDVGKLVLLDYVLTGDRFASHSEHLPIADREPARLQLENQRKNLTEQLRTALRQSYGVQTLTEQNIGQQVGAGDAFPTLVPGFTVRTPQATTLLGGLNDVLSQALDQQFPEHPPFQPGDTEVSRNQLSWTLELIRRAASEGGRVEGIERARANQVRRITEALRLGQLRENVYALSTSTFDWWMRFTQWAAEAGDRVMVGDLRKRLERYGMTSDVEDLLILGWAALADRQWVRNAIKMPAPAIGSLASDMALHPADLPDEDTFATAVARGETVFGIRRELYRNTASVSRLAGELRTKAADVRKGVDELVTELEKHRQTLSLDGAAEGRLATAHRARDLVKAISDENDPKALIETVALFDLPDEPQPLARSMASAHAVVAALRGATWELIDQLGTFDDDRDRAVREALHEAARLEELHQPLATALNAARQGVVELLRKVHPPKPPKPDSDPVDPVVVDPDDVDLVIDDGVTLDDVTAKLKVAYDKKVVGKKLRVRWRWE